MVDSNKRVAIINGEPESATAMYRCDSAINCFKLLGFYVEVFGVESILTGCLDLFQICYFVRVPACSLMEALFERLRTMGVKIIADFDDLIFDANCINLINGLNYLSEIDRIQFLDNVVKYKKWFKWPMFLLPPLFRLQMRHCNSIKMCWLLRIIL